MVYVSLKGAKFITKLEEEIQKKHTHQKKNQKPPSKTKNNQSTENHKGWKTPLFTNSSSINSDFIFKHEVIKLVKLMCRGVYLISYPAQTLTYF